MIFKPYLHQRKALRFISDREASMLMSGTGMGDTVVALSVAVELMYERFVTDRILIVASSRSIQGKWKKELEKWDHLNLLKAGYIRGSDAERRRILKEGAGIYFITHESLGWLVKEDSFLFTYVIVDDFHLYRNPDTKRFKRIKRIRDNLNFFLALSSLSSLDHPEDLWGQLYLLDGGKRLEERRAGFYDRYFFTKKYKYDGYERIVREPKEGALQRIRERISDICFVDDPSLKLASVLNRYCNVYTKMEGPEYSKYRLLDKGIFSVGMSSEEIEKESRTIKRMQAANGIIYDKNKDVHVLHTHKVDEIKRILQSTMNERVLIAYWFRHEKEVLCRLIPQLSVLEIYDDVNKWRKGELKTALISAATESAVFLKRIETDVLIWFSLPWSVSAYERLNNCVMKKGGTTVYHLLTEKTVDEELILNIENNRARLAALGGA